MKCRLLSRVFLYLILALASWASNSVTAYAQTEQTSSTDHTSFDLAGTWSGTLTPNDRALKSVPINVVIAMDAKGVLFAASILASDCIKDPTFHVSRVGSVIVLAGSDAEGDSLTLRGALDKTASL